MSLFQSKELMALGNSVFLWGRLTSGHWFWTHSLQNFWSLDIAEWTRPFWVRAGSVRIRLSRTFRGPFANLSRISRLKNTISETNDYARVAFIICVSQGANFRTWDDTKVKPVRIHRQKKADVYISLHIYLSKCCIDAIYSPKHGSCGNSGRKTAKPKHEYYNIYVYK